MIVNYFLSLDMELKVLLLFGILLLIYETMREIKNKWQQKNKQKNYK
jgi:hypothetical protein